MQKQVTFNPSVKVSTIGTSGTSSTQATTTPLAPGGGSQGTEITTPSAKAPPGMIPLSPTPVQVALAAGSQSQPQQVVTGTHDVRPATASTNLTQGFSFGFPPTSPAATTTSTVNQPASSGLTSVTMVQQQPAGSSLNYLNVPASTSSVVTTVTSTLDNSFQGQINQGQVSSASANQQQQATTTTQGTTMTFQQLQDVLNSCMAELQEQEEIFEKKIKEVNDWDRIMESNGEKITQLQLATDTVKRDHVRIDSGLSFLKTQQLELENALGQLEHSLSGAPPPEDPERFRLYHMALSVDKQLLQTGMDLKDVIDQLNERSSLEESLPLNDPLVQILKILNEHNNALVWIEDSCGKLNKYLTEVREQHTNLKKDHVASMRRSMK